MLSNMMFMMASFLSLYTTADAGRFSSDGSNSGGDWHADRT